MGVAGARAGPAPSVFVATGAPRTAFSPKSYSRSAWRSSTSSRAMAAWFTCHAEVRTAGARAGGSGAVGREAGDSGGRLFRPSAADHLIIDHSQVGLAAFELGVSGHLRDRRVPNGVGARWRARECQEADLFVGQCRGEVELLGRGGCQRVPSRREDPRGAREAGAVVGHWSKARCHSVQFRIRGLAPSLVPPGLASSSCGRPVPEATVGIHWRKSTLTKGAVRPFFFCRRSISEARESIRTVLARRRALRAELQQRMGRAPGPCRGGQVGQGDGTQFRLKVHVDRGGVVLGKDACEFR